MTIYSRIKQDLEASPTLRERRFSRNYLMEQTLKDCGLTYKWIDGTRFSLDDLLEIAIKYDSWRHEYSAVQRDNKDLRGDDYSDGKVLAQEKQIEYGYEPNYHKDKNLADKLF